MDSVPTHPQIADTEVVLAITTTTSFHEFLDLPDDKKRLLEGASTAHGAMVTTWFTTVGDRQAAEAKGFKPLAEYPTKPEFWAPQKKKSVEPVASSEDQPAPVSEGGEPVVATEKAKKLRGPRKPYGPRKPKVSVDDASGGDATDEKPEVEPEHEDTSDLAETPAASGKKIGRPRGSASALFGTPWDPRKPSSRISISTQNGMYFRSIENPGKRSADSYYDSGSYRMMHVFCREERSARFPQGASWYIIPGTQYGLPLWYLIINHFIDSDVHVYES